MIFQFSEEDFDFLEAQYVGIWTNGKRQGPGEMHFGQYRYVGKFHENYVKSIRIFDRFFFEQNHFDFSPKVKVDSFLRIIINKMANITSLQP